MFYGESLSQFVICFFNLIFFSLPVFLNQVKWWYRMIHGLSTVDWVVRLPTGPAILDRLVTNIPYLSVTLVPVTNIWKMSPTVGDQHLDFVTNTQKPAPTLSRQHHSSRFLSFMVINFLAPALRIEISFAVAHPSPIPIEFGSNCSSHCCYDGGIG